MPLVFTITYTVVDGKGAEATTEVKVPDSLDFADVLEFAISMGGVIAPLMAGALRSASIAAKYVFAYSEPADFSDVEEGAYFQFLTSDGFTTSMRIPTFLEANLISNSREVDLAEADVIAFVTAMTDGIELEDEVTIVEPVDKRADDVVALDFARESFQSSRRR